MPFHKATHIKDGDFIEVNSAFRRKVITFQHNYSSEHDVEIYIDKMKEEGVNSLTGFLDIYKNMKAYLELQCKFFKIPNETTEPWFGLSNEILSESSDLDEFWAMQTEKFKQRYEVVTPIMLTAYLISQY